MESKYYWNLNIKSNLGLKKVHKRGPRFYKAPPSPPPPPHRKKGKEIYVVTPPKLEFLFVFTFLCIIISLFLQRQRNLNLHDAVNFNQWKKVTKIQNFKRKVQTAPT